MTDWRDKLRPAGDWILDPDPRPRMVLGNSTYTVWPDGEPFYIVGDTGHGKSTLAQNIVRTGLGLQMDTLGWGVPQPWERVLYLAADRPKQIKYSLRRMVNEAEREAWNRHVLAYEGPPPFDIHHERREWVEWVCSDLWVAGPPQVVIVDSLKDMTQNLTDDEVGADIALAFRQVLDAGVQLLITHHPRKRSNEAKKANTPPSMDDVYGSFKFTGSAGAVLYIQPTDDRDLKKIYHLKAADEQLPEMKMRFDRATGLVRLEF